MLVSHLHIDSLGAAKSRIRFSCFLWFLPLVVPWLEISEKNHFATAFVNHDPQFSRRANLRTDEHSHKYVSWPVLSLTTNDNNNFKGKRQDQSNPVKNTRSGPANLNSEIFGLRQQKNGVSLAERRLHEAIEAMYQDGDLAHETLSSKNDTQKLRWYPNEVSFNAILSAYAKNAKRDWMAPHKAEQLFRKMKDLSQDFPHLQPSAFTYNAVLEGYAKNANSRNLRRAQQSKMAILRIYRELVENPSVEPDTFTNNLVLTSNTRSSQDWQDLELWAVNYLENPDNTQQLPDRNTYNQLLSAYAQAGDALKAERLLNTILEVTKTGHKSELTKSLKASRVWFNLFLKALASSSKDLPSAGDKADDVLKLMNSLYKEGYSEKIHPDTSTYNHVLNVHSRLGNTVRAEQVVAEMIQISGSTEYNNDWELLPDRISFTTLLKAYATRQRQNNLSVQQATEVASNATKVFEKMQSLSSTRWSHVTPNEFTYNTLISIWSQVGTRHALNTATTLLQDMCHDPNTQPDSVTYTTLIHGWSRGVKYLARLPEAGYRAEQLLQELEQLPPERKRRDFSHTTIYNAAIKAWSKSGEAIAAQKVESLLLQLEGKYSNGHEDARPDKITFLGMIDAYAKLGIPDAGDRCEVLLQRMASYRDTLEFDDLDPDRTVYNAVLNALAKSFQNASVEKAEEILTMMQTSPNKCLRPDIVTYATVIDCYTKCGDGSSSERAEELLRYVEGNYRGGDKSLKPNAVFYSAILQAWAKTATADGARKAEELLRRNFGLYEEGHRYAKPHAIMFNAVMDAIARTGDQNAGRRAEELLNEMESLYLAGDGDFKPSRRSFNAVILAYGNAGDGGRKAEELLCRMEDLAASGRPELAPDVVSYNSAISIIVDDKNHGDTSTAPGRAFDYESAAERAQALLDRMEERNIRPDGRTYSPVIEAWLKRNDEKGRQLAEVMLQQFLEKVESHKQRSKATKKNGSLHEEEVWSVINAYRKPDEAAED